MLDFGFILEGQEVLHKFSFQLIMSRLSSIPVNQRVLILGDEKPQYEGDVVNLAVDAAGSHMRVRFGNLMKGASAEKKKRALRDL